MSRQRHLYESPFAWGALTFVLMFLFTSFIANDFWRDGRHESLRQIFDAELRSIQSEAAQGRLPPISPWRRGGGLPNLFLIRSFLEGAPIPQIQSELTQFLESNPEASHWQKKDWTSWRRTLEEIQADVPGGYSLEKEVDRKLHQARWHIARAQGWLVAGNVDRGLVHFLQAIVLCRDVLLQGTTDEHQVEASFIAGKSFYLLFNRPALLREVSGLGHSAIWSMRAERILMKDMRS